MRHSPDATKPLAELVEKAELRLVEDQESDLPKIEGVGSRGDVVNKNGRYYPTEVLKRAVQEAQTALAEGSFTGELEHPEFGLGSLERTAIRFTRLWMDGSDVRFEGRVLNTPAGQTLRQLMEGGVKVGMSTRGVGRVRWTDEDDFMSDVALVEDYHLYGMDAVKMPSNEAGMAKLKESIQGLEEPHTKEEVSMNLEELKAQHPELVAQIEEAAATAARAELQPQIDELKTQIDESETAAKEQTDIRAAIRGALLEAGVISESEVAPAEKDELLEAANAKVTELETKVTELQGALAATVQKVEFHESREAIRTKYDELTKENEFADFIAESISLDEFNAPEDVEREVTRLTKLAESVSQASKVEDVAGKGELNESRRNASTEEDDEMARYRALAGL